jgi:hypothetical protein
MVLVSAILPDRLHAALAARIATAAERGPDSACLNAGI